MHLLYSCVSGHIKSSILLSFSTTTISGRLGSITWSVWSGYLHRRGFWLSPSLSLVQPYVGTIVPNTAGHTFQYCIRFSIYIGTDWVRLNFFSKNRMHRILELELELEQPITTVQCSNEITITIVIVWRRGCCGEMSIGCVLCAYVSNATRECGLIVSGCNKGGV